MPIANGCFVAVVNPRLGMRGKPEKGDPGIEFLGEFRFVADPAGQLMGGGLER